MTMIDTITRTVTYPVPIERVWDVLTSPDYLVRWMCSSIGPFQVEPGEIIHFAWESEPFRARITQVEPPVLFAWEWYPGAGEDVSIPLDDQGPLTTVTFRLEAVDAGTCLTVTETGFAALTDARNAQALADNNVGWDECLAQIAGLLAV